MKRIYFVTIIFAGILSASQPCDALGKPYDQFGIGVSLSKEQPGVAFCEDGNRCLILINDSKSPLHLPRKLLDAKAVTAFPVLADVLEKIGVTELKVSKDGQESVQSEIHRIKELLIKHCKYAMEKLKKPIALRKLESIEEGFKSGTATLGELLAYAKFTGKISPETLGVFPVEHQDLIRRYQNIISTLGSEMIGEGMPVDIKTLKIPMGNAVCGNLPPVDLVLEECKMIYNGHKVSVTIREGRLFVGPVYINPAAIAGLPPDQSNTHWILSMTLQRLGVDCSICLIDGELVVVVYKIKVDGGQVRCVLYKAAG